MQNAPAISITAALLFFLGLQIAAAWLAGGFEYPLDDTYIHLSIASEIARGGYGVNSGEYASAASSALFPYLLAVAPDTQFQRFLPLFWNVVGLIAAAHLWGKIVFATKFETNFKLLLAVLGPLLLNLGGVAFTGMEHALHTAASLAILWGLIRLVEEDQLSWWLIAGIVFAPLLRFEGMALALLAVGVIFLHGQILRSVWLGAVAVIPLALFMMYLLSLGLDPFPNSVQVKIDESQASSGGLVERLLFKLRSNLIHHGGFALLASIFGLLLAFVASRADQTWGWRLILLALLAATVAHFLIGRTGWMNRYEIYIYATATAGLIFWLGRKPSRWMGPLAIVYLAAVGAPYVVDLTTKFVRNSRGMSLQQGQMARFAQDYAQTNVAVNDLGRVAWGNKNHVLDLWGLASDEAMQIRLNAATDEWAGPLVEKYEVELIMVYPRWFDTGLDKSWVELGELRLHVPTFVIGGYAVKFFAVDEDAKQKFIPQLEEFIPTIPEGAEWVWAEAPA